MNHPTTHKQQVFIVVARPIGVPDDADTFFMGFVSEKGGTEYLMLPKNGQPEPKPGTYEIPNRFGIGPFNLSKESENWFADLPIERGASLLTKQP